MIPIPRDIDEIMWALAESPTSPALDDFEMRFPQYLGEMGRRLQMVRELKAAGQATRPMEIPHFNAPAPLTRTQRFWPVAAASLGIAALGFASFQVASSWRNQPSEAQQIKIQPAQTKVGPWGTSDGISPKTVPDLPPRQAQPGTGNELTVEPGRITLRLLQVPLATALSILGSESGLKIEIAPGLPNIMVSVDAVDQLPMDVLEELGRTYGFTGFSQEKGHVLIIPARTEGISDDSGESNR